LLSYLKPVRLASLGAVLLVAACSGPAASTAPTTAPTPALTSAPTAAGPTSPPAGSIQINGAGATFPFPLYSRWFYEYAFVDPSVHFNYQSIGSGGGIKQITEKTVDFGASDAILNDEQFAAAPGIQMFPTVAGAVVPAYNVSELAEGDPIVLDAATLSGTFLGTITKWNDPAIAALNAGVTLPDKDIIVVHRSDGSGTTFIFTDFLSKASPTWKRQVGRATSVNWPIGLGGKGNEGVTQQVKQAPGSMGYVELIYALSNGLPSAKVRNAAGVLVQPTLKSVAAAAAEADLPPDTDFRVSITNAPGPDSYPISSFTWLLIRKEDPDTARAKTIRGFVAWMLQPPARRMAADLHYAPLPVKVIEMVQERIVH